MGRPTQPIHTLDRDRVRPLPLNLRTHLLQTMGEVDNLRLPRGVFQNGCAFGQRRRHQRIFGCPDRDKGEVDHPTLQPTGRFGMHIAFFQLQLSTHRFKRFEVQIHRACANCTAPGKRDNRMPVPRQHRPEHEDGSAHFAYDIVMRHMVVDCVARHREHLTILQAGHLCPQRLQQGRHRLDIAQTRRIGQRQRLLAQQRGGHQSQTGVLGPGNRDLTRQRPVSCDNNLIHCSSLPFCLFCLPRHPHLDPRAPWLAPCAGQGSLSRPP